MRRFITVSVALENRELHLVRPGIQRSVSTALMFKDTRFYFLNKYNYRREAMLILSMLLLLQTAAILE